MKPYGVIWDDDDDGNDEMFHDVNDEMICDHMRPYGAIWDLMGPCGAHIEREIERERWRERERTSERESERWKDKSLRQASVKHNAVPLRD